MNIDQQLADQITRQLTERAGTFVVTDATSALARFRAGLGNAATVLGVDRGLRVDQGDREPLAEVEVLLPGGPGGHRPPIRRPRLFLVAAVLLVVAGLAVVVGRRQQTDQEVVAAPPPITADDIAAATGEDWVITVEGEHVFPHPPDWVISTDVACPSGPVLLIAASRAVDPCVATRDVPLTGDALAFIAATEVPERRGAPGGGINGAAGVVIEASALIRPVLSGGPWELVAGGSDPTQRDLASAVAYRYTTTPGLVAEEGPARPPEWPAPDWSSSPAERLREVRDTTDYPVLSPAEVPTGWYIQAVSGDDRSSVVELGHRSKGHVGIPVDLLVCSSPAANPSCQYDAIDFTHERTYAGTTWECGFVRIGVRAPWWCRRPLPDGSWVSFSVAAGTIRADHLDQILRALTDGP